MRPVSAAAGLCAGRVPLIGGCPPECSAAAKPRDCDSAWRRDIALQRADGTHARLTARVPIPDGRLHGGVRS